MRMGLKNQMQQMTVSSLYPLDWKNWLDLEEIEREQDLGREVGNKVGELSGMKRTLRR